MAFQADKNKLNEERTNFPEKVVPQWQKSGEEGRQYIRNKISF